MQASAGIALCPVALEAYPDLSLYQQLALLPHRVSATFLAPDMWCRLLRISRLTRVPEAPP